MIKAAGVFILMAALAGCFNPNTPSQYHCDEKTAPDCPDGYDCVGKVCVDKNQKPDAGDASANDMEVDKAAPDKKVSVDQQLADKKLEDKKLEDKKLPDPDKPKPPVDVGPPADAVPPKDTGSCAGGYSSTFSGTGVPPEWNKVSGTWSQLNGVLRQGDTANTGKPHSGFHLLYYSKKPYSDFSLEVDSNFISGGTSTTNALGLVYHYTDSSNFYMVYYEPSGEFEFLMVKKGTYSWQSKKTGWGKAHKLKVVVKGDKHTIYRDGSAVITNWQEGSLSSGYVGLVTFQAEATFDNFKVCKLP